MLTLYLVCLIFGGGLLAFSLLAGADHGDSDAHISLDSNTDIDHNLHISAISDTSSHIELNSHIDNSPTHLSNELINQNIETDSIKFISFRNAIYFTAFFGLTGTAFTYIAVNFIFTLLSSLSMGTFAAWFGYKLMKYLKSSESGKTIDISELVGKLAIVNVNIKKHNKGKISLQHIGQTIELSALISENSEREEFTMRQKVLIYEIRNNIAYVIEQDF